MKTIKFQEDSLPFDIISENERYKICTRRLNKIKDSELIRDKVETGAFCSFQEAYNYLKYSSVYTIVDLKEQIRGSDNYVIWDIDYSKKEDCKKLLQRLNTGEVEISHRNRIKLLILD